MSNFIVRIDHMKDDEVCFRCGWVCLDKGDEFSLYWNPRYNETQVVSNDPPRYLIVDDLNDVQLMDGPYPVIRGPQRHH
jgi:hypothetical protein